MIELAEKPGVEQKDFIEQTLRSWYILGHLGASLGVVASFLCSSDATFMGSCFS